jgi:hypothetical protein
MAGIWAVLPGATAAAIDTVLAETARTARTAGDPRTVDQLRADTFAAALLHNDAGSGATGPGALGTIGSGALGTAAGGTATISTGAIGPCVAGRPGATTCTAGAPFPGGGLYPMGASFGLTWGTSPAPTGPALTGPALTGSAPTGPDLVGLGSGVRVDVTVSLTTLLGLDEAAGQLAGYGPITAQTARRLAAAGTWRRLITDPVTGTVMDVGKTRYRPPDDLAELIRARDTRCLSPFCEVAANRCDLDHREPFAPDGTGGATSAANLGSLCRRDHLLKTHARWHLTTDPDAEGTYCWTTPTGHVYTHRPDPPPGHEPPQSEPLDFDAPPPF